MMKKYLPLLALLIVSVFAAVLFSGSSKKLEGQTAEDVDFLAAQWETHLKAVETVDSWMTHVYRDVQTFTEDNSWDSLLKARMSCKTVQNWLSRVELPVLDLSKEQIERLNEAGIEVVAIQVEYSCLPEQIRQYEVDLEVLGNILQHDVYLKEGFQYLPDRVNYNLENMADMQKYLCFTTNDLLLSMNKRGLWNDMAKKYPTVFAHMESWCSDEDQLYWKASQVLDHYSENHTKYQELIGTQEYLLSLMKEAYVTKDPSPLAGHIHKIEGISEVFPAPAWLDGSEKAIYVADSETGKFVPEPEDTLDHVPSGCQFTSENVDRKEVEDYAAMLEEWGIRVHRREKNSSYIDLMIYSDSGAMMVTWYESGTAKVIQADPIPALIPDIFLLASVLE